MYVSLTYPLNIVQHTLSQIVEHCKLESTPDNIVWPPPTTLCDQLWRHVGPTMCVNLTFALESSQHGHRISRLF